MTVRLRPYGPADAAPTLEVFRRAVRLTAAADYGPEQVAAWAPDDLDPAAWAVRRAERNTVVAEVDGRVVGFTDVDATGYLDMMYVDPAVGGRGVGRALLAWALEEASRAGAEVVRTHASITARPFFEAHGFRVDAVRHPVRNGVVFENFAMSRVVRGSG
ncbi:putative N-acetyltransferase YafP [Agromyces sp. NDB4Y10]|uniref:GNAT family N-acetyltransferase n=1 Tax=Agromyces sp. NDB4Y10 TaxID=1775951 RepID=UPI0007B2A162|nr:GNAT family N-acetyltransferase [Agromyces sp. NDB4Y10]KZE94777.1 putative N-acetyltransferase YafP [Agromyces sp. NDB4Y10]